MFRVKNSARKAIGEVSFDLGDALPEYVYDQVLEIIPAKEKNPAQGKIHVRLMVAPELVFLWIFLTCQG